jgi:hypothetical protein
MVLMGGRNEEEKQNSIYVYKLEPKGIQMEVAAKFQCKDGVSGDFFPQNQWIVTEKNEETIKLYVLGRFGTYFVDLRYNEKDDSLGLKSAQYAEEGFNKHH